MCSLTTRPKAVEMEKLIRQFGMFGMVGVAGLLVDMATLRLCLKGLGLDFYSARVLSFLPAATATWALNRRFTFRTADHAPLLRQWAGFVAANSVGGLVNYAVYATLVTYSPRCAQWPEIAVAAGSVAGMFLNFAASKRLIFRGA
jgi:putative flippase GtrA